MKSTGLKSASNYLFVIFLALSMSAVSVVAQGDATTLARVSVSRPYQIYVT